MNNEVIEKLRANKQRFSSLYRNLYTVFSSTGDRAQKLDSRACFGNVLKYTYGDMDNTYTIYTFIEDQPSVINHCIFTPEEIRNYLAYIADVVPFEFEVSDIQRPENDSRVLRVPYIKIFVHINGPHINHVFILTMIRYLYEYPYKCVLADVFRMKEIPEFSKISIFNLYNTIAFSIDISSYCCHFSNDMSHYDAQEPVLFMRKRDIAERMAFLTENVNGKNLAASICDIFPINDRLKGPERDSNDWYKPKVQKFSPMGLKFIKAHRFVIDENDSRKGDRPDIIREFLLDDFFKERLNVYRNNIKILIDATDEQIKTDIEKANKHLTTFNRDE